MFTCVSARRARPKFQGVPDVLLGETWLGEAETEPCLESSLNWESLSFPAKRLGGWLWAYDGLFVASRVQCGFDAGMPIRAVGPALSFICDRGTCVVAVAGRRRVSGSLAERGKMPECDVNFWAYEI